MLIHAADHVYRSGPLQDVPWLIHGFGTRLSDGWPGDYVRVKQIHSDLILRADAEDLREVTADESGVRTLGSADALITSTPGIIVGVRTADCVPLLLVDPETRAVAAVHAGWRGTVQWIAAKAVERMKSEYGSRPDRLIAAIGPTIGRCCFEVGQEVADRFRPMFPEAVDLNRIDLIEANRRQLASAGVPARSIDTGDLCTRCRSDLHSYRRDKEASGRMVAAVGIRAD